MLWLRYKGLRQNNPLASFVICFCRQRSGREWLASSSI